MFLAEVAIVCGRNILAVFLLLDNTSGRI